MTSPKPYKKKIILIDDDPEFADLIRMALAEFDDLDLIHASGGPEGLAMIEKHRPNLILLDLMMPLMNGWDVYRNIKDRPHLAAIPVLVLTALRMRGDRYFGFQVAKVEGYVYKPFLPSQLRERVQAFL